jgi:hypothetical protein
LCVFFIRRDVSFMSKTESTVELHRQRIPRGLLLLDALGAVLAAIGVLDVLDTGPRLLPAALRFPGAGIALIILGCIVMLAVPVWLLKEHRRRSGRAQEKPRS